jgi:release factor glutamine methyltransferase
MTEPNHILYYLKKSTEFLEKKGLPTPRVDAEWILSDLLGLPRIKLYAQFETPLSESNIKIYRERIVERGKKKPVAYITGKKGFHRFDFIVNEHVLIPRPETEELVDWFFKNHKQYLQTDTKIKLLDLCTGSGCIAISISRLLPELEVWASDISEEALNVAKENQKLVPNPSATEISFLASNLFSEFPKELTFDVILSNPPYIPESEKNSIMDDVLLFEPHLALFVANFEEFHLRLLRECKERLNPNGILVLETHPDYIEFLISEATNVGFVQPEIIKDSSAKNRFLVIRKGS